VTESLAMGGAERRRLGDVRTHEGEEEQRLGGNTDTRGWATRTRRRATAGKCVRCRNLATRGRGRGLETEKLPHSGHACRRERRWLPLRRAPEHGTSSSGTSRESCTAASMLESSSKKTREENGGGGRE
jgi:hypothetical protein